MDQQLARMNKLLKAANLFGDFVPFLKLTGRSINNFMNEIKANWFVVNHHSTVRKNLVFRILYMNHKNDVRQPLTR